MIAEREPGRIFLSYRRTDAQHLAGRLFDRLEARFGTGNVFMDVDSIEPGQDYGEVIDKAVSSCNVLLAVIGRGWLDAVDEHHRRRLDDPDDLIVLEIATALQRNIRVIPVLVEGAAPPRRDDLPEILAPLARRQVVRLDHVGFNATMTTLLAALERALATAHAESDLRGDSVADNDHHTSSSTFPARRSIREWTVDDFTLLLRDRRPSARRIVAVLDTLARQPDVEVALSDLAVTIGLSRSELRGAFNGLTYLCKQLRPDVDYDWPIIWRHGTSTQPGQAQETWYHIRADIAARWLQVHRHHTRDNDRAAQATTAQAASQPGGKSAAYAAFWTLMLGRIRIEHSGWTRSRNPGTQNWFGMPSPFRGDATYTLVFGQHNTLRSELYIDHLDPARVGAIYAALHRRKDRIERLFGEPLAWEELPTRRASRIAAYSDIDGDILVTGRYDQYIQWFLDAQQRLRKAIDLVLPQVRAELESATVATSIRPSAPNAG